jgi:hypothetical protein
LGLPLSLLKRTLSEQEDPNRVDSYTGFAGGWEEWQYGSGDSRGEIFADMFLGWVFDTWATKPQGQLTDMAKLRRDHMSTNMIDLIMITLNR